MSLDGEMSASDLGSNTGPVKIVSETPVTFDYYSCEEAIKRLNDYLDQELGPGERDDVVKHLQLCKPCLERFHFEEHLVTAVRIRVTRTSCPKELKARLKDLIRQLGHQ
jgi:anti-sigma factor (TIGR02949 family)